MEIIVRVCSTLLENPGILPTLIRSNISTRTMRTKLILNVLLLATALSLHAQPTQKPVLHGRHWMAITGKPLAATAGSMIFQKGGNAIDATCAMLAATCTMWDVLSWGGETQASIYNPKTRPPRSSLDGHNRQTTGRDSGFDDFPKRRQRH